MAERISFCIQIVKCNFNFNVAETLLHFIAKGKSLTALADVLRYFFSSEFDFQQRDFVCLLCLRMKQRRGTVLMYNPLFVSICIFTSIF